MTHFQDLSLDHVRFSVSAVTERAAQLTEAYGLEVYARAGFPDQRASPLHSVALGTDRIRIVLSEAHTIHHPAAAYVAAHGDGVSDIALRTADARAAFDEAVRRGARPLADPAEQEGIVTASIAAFGDVTHTFVQRPPGTDPRRLPGFSAAGTAGQAEAATGGPGLGTVDHFAVCVEAGQLDTTVSFYCDTLDFEAIYTERITVGSQAMNSQVVQSSSGDITLTVIEPDITQNPGQIDSFLKDHGGPGVQHIALTSDDIVASVGTLVERGVEFLDTPHSYYDLLRERLAVTRHSVDSLRSLDILVDEDHDGQLYQIFTRSTHPRRTFFFEVIERRGATTFGSGNIKALYEAVEWENCKASG